MRTLLLRIVFLILLFNPLHSFGQDNGYNSFERLGISTGANFYSIKDELLSPLVYTGTTIPINLSYDRSNRIGHYEVGLSFDKTTLKSSITETQEFTGSLEGHFSEYWSLSITGHFLSKFLSREKFRILAGGRLHGMGIYRMHTIVKVLPWDISYGFINFQAAILAQKKIFENHWIDVYAAYGVAALTLGNQYSRVLTGSDWQFPGNFNNLFTKISYHVPWTEKIDSGVEYRFNYQSYNKDLPYQLGSHQILVMLNYRL
jgi:hypothetical protein